MREAFDEKLRGLIEQIMKMGGLAEQMLADALGGLFADDTHRLDLVDPNEQKVNALQLAIDDAAVSLTVAQQPVARDVRMIFVATRCAADIERVADQATNIAGSARHIIDAIADERADLPPQLGELAQAARTSFSNALAAIVGLDVQLAQQVLADEPRVDELRDHVFKEVLYELITRPAASSAALSILLISRNLERIGDHATNIAEELIYLVRGQDVRHGRAG